MKRIELYITKSIRRVSKDEDTRTCKYLYIKYFSDKIGLYII